MGGEAAGQIFSQLVKPWCCGWGMSWGVANMGPLVRCVGMSWCFARGMSWRVTEMKPKQQC